MSWSGGTDIMLAVIDAVRLEVPSDATRTRIYKQVLQALGDKDWDNEDEVLGEDPACDKALAELYPNIYSPDA